MISLGCAKNLVDAETLLGETLGERFALALDPEMADVVIVNTCGFIEDARQEARETLTECLKLKAAAEASGKQPPKIVAVGCWAQREPEKLLEEFPGLDGVWGLGVDSNLADSIRALGENPAERTAPAIRGIDNGKPVRDGARLLTTAPAFAYLRLSDGCDNRCDYCAIPLIRGALRSRRPEAVMDEAKALEDQGVRELILIAQDTTAYGRDLGRPGVRLATLVEKMLAAVSVPRIRLLYAHPAHLDDDVVRLLQSQPRLCGYLDLPIQHISDRVLARMGRGYGRDRVQSVVDRLAGRDFTLRTTLLTGFPGETEADFRELLAFVEEGHFRHLGAYAYSPEAGTPAAGLPHQVPPETAEERRRAILEAQAGVAFAWLDSRVGKTEAILVDARVEANLVRGRSSHEAPDADGDILVRNRVNEPGDIIMATIKKREGYDLLGSTKTAGKGKR